MNIPTWRWHFASEIPDRCRNQRGLMYTFLRKPLFWKYYREMELQRGGSLDWDRSTRMHDSSIYRSYSADVMDTQVSKKKLRKFWTSGVCIQKVFQVVTLLTGKMHLHGLQRRSLLQVCVNVAKLCTLKLVNKKGPRMSFLFLLLTCYMYVTVIVQFLLVKTRDWA